MEQKYMYVLDREKYAKKSITNKNVISNNLNMLTKNTADFIKILVCVGLISFFENNSATNK